MELRLKEAYAQSQKLRSLYKQKKYEKNGFKSHLALEGLPRNASTHAAGVVLSPIPLVDVVPIQMGHDDLYLTQWPMKEVEASWLIKNGFFRTAKFNDY